ncbi:MAG TPA: hypothetical protein VHV83_11160, partial [Armatimonadota bacterium]|nr:hypothetical protein [Armatimonadota bacterium]
MEWFDCHVEFGRRMVPSPLQQPDAAGLASLYAEIGIQRALVIHPAFYQQHPKIGNARIVAETKEYPQFEPTWAILPPCTDELGSLDDFFTGMKAAGVRALWAFPSDHRYTFNSFTCGPLFEELSARKIPLFLQAGALGQVPGNWDNLARVVMDFPTLRLVVCPVGVWGDDRYFRPFLERKTACRFMSTTYMVEGGLKALVDR